MIPCKNWGSRDISWRFLFKRFIKVPLKKKRQDLNSCPAAANLPKKKSLLRPTAGRQQQHLVYRQKNTVFNAYIPNAPNTLLGSVLPGTPNPLQSYLQKGAWSKTQLRNFPFYTNILTFRIISIHEFIGLWVFRKLHVFHLQHSWCICWSGEGVWRCEPFCPTTGGLNSYQNSLWGIFQPAFWMIISRLCEEKLPPKWWLPIIWLNTECNQTKNNTTCFSPNPKWLLCISV